MRDARKTHLAIRDGLLCGAKLIDFWTLNELRVTCAACRSLIQARKQERRESIQEAVVMLATILKETY